MYRKGLTVQAQVTVVLNQRKETSPNAYHDIKTASQYEIDKFISEFRRDYSHLIAYPYKDSTVNRYVELWLKRQV